MPTLKIAPPKPLFNRNDIDAIDGNPVTRHNSEFMRSIGVSLAGFCRIVILLIVRL